MLHSFVPSRAGRIGICNFCFPLLIVVGEAQAEFEVFDCASQQTMSRYDLHITPFNIIYDRICLINSDKGVFLFDLEKNWWHVPVGDTGAATTLFEVEDFAALIPLRVKINGINFFEIWGIYYLIVVFESGFTEMFRIIGSHSFKVETSFPILKVDSDFVVKVGVLKLAPTVALISLDDKYSCFMTLLDNREKFVPTEPFSSVVVKQPGECEVLCLRGKRVEECRMLLFPAELLPVWQGVEISRVVSTPNGVLVAHRLGDTACLSCMQADVNVAPPLLLKAREEITALVQLEIKEGGVCTVLVGVKFPTESESEYGARWKLVEIDREGAIR